MMMMMSTRRMRSCAKQQVLPFPEEIVIEILRRLPLISILTCKRVSKAWKNFINDPKFYKLYYPLDKSGLGFVLLCNNLYCLLVNGDGGGFSVHEHPIKLLHSTRSPSYGNHTLLNSGWSNGLICVKSTSGQFLFHNLLTGASFMVENAPCRRYCHMAWLCYGFAYEPYSDDYIILVVCKYDTINYVALHTKSKRNRDYINKVQNKDSTIFWLYSLRNKRWKSFEGFPRSYASKYYWEPAQGHSINGVLHWLVRCKDNKSPTKEDIFTYNLRTGRFGEIGHPTRGQRLGTTYLAEFDGKLCYMCVRKCDKKDHTYYFDVWVLDTIGDSWEKTISIGCRRENFLPFHWQVTPAMLYEFGDDRRRKALFVTHYNRDNVFWYDFNDNKVELLHPNCLTSTPIAGFNLIPSLRN